MRLTVEKINQITSVLKEEQKQLLKDAIISGGWGDADADFLNSEGERETVDCWVYITNCTKKMGHFSGKKISAMFRAIYSRLCPADGHCTGEYLSHCTDWWGDGSGDVMFVRYEDEDAWEEWARR